MSTTSSIGTSGRNYSTIGGWLAAFASGGWIGECYNDSTFTISSTVSFTGHSTSATDYIILRTGSGQSYRDNANVQTNAFTYNASNGVALTGNLVYANVVDIPSSGDDYVTIQNLQIQNTGGGNFGPLGNNLGVGPNCYFENLILESNGSGLLGSRSGTWRNCLGEMRSNSAGSAVAFAYGSAIFVNCTFVRPNGFTVGGTGFNNITSSSTKITNCAVFGFTNFSSGSGFSGSNNASDVTIGFGSSNQASVTYANQFVQYSDSGRDFKVKNNSANIYDTGATDTTDLPAAIDAVGTSRPQGSAWDIGAWELVVVASFNPGWAYGATKIIGGVF